MSASFANRAHLDITMIHLTAARSPLVPSATVMAMPTFARLRLVSHFVQLYLCVLIDSVTFLFTIIIREIFANDYADCANESKFNSHL